MYFRFSRASQLCFKSTSKAFFTFPIIYLVYPNPHSRQIARLFLQSSELGLPPNAGECVPPLWFRGEGHTCLG